MKEFDKFLWSHIPTQRNIFHHFLIQLTLETGECACEKLPQTKSARAPCVNKKELWSKDISISSTPENKVKSKTNKTMLKIALPSKDCLTEIICEFKCRKSMAITAWILGF